MARFEFKVGDIVRLKDPSELEEDDLAAWAASQSSRISVFGIGPYVVEKTYTTPSHPEDIYVRARALNRELEETMVGCWSIRLKPFDSGAELPDMPDFDETRGDF